MPIAQPGLAKLFAKLRGTHAEHAAAFQALEQAFDCEVASLARDRISLRGDLDALAGDRAVLAREVDALARDVALSQNVQEQLTSEANALQGDREALSQQFELSKEVEKHLVGEAAALEVDREALSQQMNLSLKVGQEFIDDAASQSDAARERASAHRAPDAARPCGVAASGGVGCGGTATGADVVVLNVGGVRFEASRIALERLDGSLLQKMFGRCGDTVNVDPCDGAVFLDRDPETFSVVLDYLQSAPPGELDGAPLREAMATLPLNARNALEAELEFFGVESPKPLITTDFTAGPQMRSGRAGCACVFAGARVFVFGGYSGEMLKTTEYLQNNFFHQGPDMLTKRSGCAAVLIEEGKVLVLGGFDGGGYVSTTEMLHVASLIIQPGPTMLAARHDCAAVALDSNRVLVVGGRNGGGYLDTTEILHIDTMTFNPGPKMAFPRFGCCAIALDPFRVMVIGGLSTTGKLSTTEILNLTTLKFYAGPTMKSARTGCAVVSVDFSHFLVIGGRNTCRTPCATTEMLDANTMAFSAGPTMPTARDGCAAATDSSGVEARIFVVGGTDGLARLASTALLRVPHHSYDVKKRRVEEFGCQAY